MQVNMNDYSVRVLKADKLTTNPLKNAMKKRIHRSANSSNEEFEEEVEIKLQEIEDLNLAFEHEMFRTRVGHIINIGDATFAYTNIFEISVITKGIITYNK